MYPDKVEKVSDAQSNIFQPRSSRKPALLLLVSETLPQIAYLENLLKMYNEEIHRLQKSELSLEDLDLGDSLFIQESKLKRKVSPEDLSLDESRKGVIAPG